MRIHVAVLFVALAAIGCKKSGTGGGGGGWLIGNAGLMVNVHDDVIVGEYELGSDANLNAIACRYAAEAWVVGDDATVLYTNDGGQSWLAQQVPTTAHLRTLATQDDGQLHGHLGRLVQAVEGDDVSGMIGRLGLDGIRRQGASMLEGGVTIPGIVLFDDHLRRQLPLVDVRK